MTEDPLVRDLLRSKTLPERLRSAISSDIMRIGGRAWARPNVCFSGRLYEKFGLADPWAPGGGRDADPISLGPVALRLGEKRRQPAPHLRPKESKAKKQSDPLAKWRRATPKPKPSPTPPPTPKPSAAPPSMFDSPPVAAAKSGPAQPHSAPSPAPGIPAVPLPVRPDLARVTGGKPPPSRPAALPSPQATPSLPGPPGPGAPPGPDRRPPMPRPARRSGRARMSARVVRSASAGPTMPPPPEVILESAPPVAAPAVESAPLAPLEETPVRPSPPPSPPPAPRRTPPTGPAGLDDIFGMGMSEGRVRMSRRKKAADPGVGED
jgi:hypothetical protein